MAAHVTPRWQSLIDRGLVKHIGGTMWEVYGQEALSVVMDEMMDAQGVQPHFCTCALCQAGKARHFN